jgi:type I restriction enzyme S subunit
MVVKPHSDLINLGPIPADWILRPLGDIGKWYSGGTPSMKIADYWFGETPWASPKDMKVPRLFDTADHITSKAISDGTRVLPIGSILIVIRGMILAHSFPVARSETPLAFNQDMKALIVSNEINSNFVLYWLIGHGQKLLGLTTESTHGTKRLPPETIYRVRITLPPTLAEQEAIASALSDADAWIESLEQLIAKKRQIKQGAMQELLTGKRRLPGFSGEWETKTIGELFIFVRNGLVYTPDSFGKSRITRIETISDGWIDFERTGTFTYSRRFDDYRLISGDILLSHINSVEHIGKSAIYNGVGELFHGMNLLLLRIAEASNAKFLHHLLSFTTTRRKLRLLAKQAVSQASINATELKAFELTVPILEEQTAIATVLSDMDTEIESLESKLAKAREIKQGMMQELLTGRIRLV